MKGKMHSLCSQMGVTHNVEVLFSKETCERLETVEQHNHMSCFWNGPSFHKKPTAI